MAYGAVIVQVMWNAWKAKCNMWFPFPDEFTRMRKMVEGIREWVALNVSHSPRIRRRKATKIHIDCINVYLYNCALYSIQNSNNLTE